MNRNILIIIAVVVLLAAVAYAVVTWGGQMAPSGASQEEPASTNYMCEDGSFYAVSFVDDETISVAGNTYQAVETNVGARYENAMFAYTIQGSSLTVTDLMSSEDVATCIEASEADMAPAPAAEPVTTGTEEEDMVMDEEATAEAEAELELESAE